MGRPPRHQDARTLIALILLGAAVTVGAMGMAGALAPAIAAGVVLLGPFAVLGLAVLVRRRSRLRAEPWEHFEEAFWDYVRGQEGLPRGVRPDE
jgi:hypothetical protein